MRYYIRYLDAKGRVVDFVKQPPRIIGVPLDLAIIHAIITSITLVIIPPLHEIPAPRVFVASVFILSLYTATLIQWRFPFKSSPGPRRWRTF